MVTLRCTQKLLRRLGMPAKATTVPPTTVLGDWYANLYYTRPQIVLCLNERTLLGVIIAARDVRSMGARFRDGVLSLLTRVGVPADAVEHEGRAMADVAFGPTANRRVLGCMNDAAYQLAAERELGRRTTWTDLELYLSENIYSATDHQRPRDLVLELFGGSVSRLH